MEPPVHAWNPQTIPDQRRHKVLDGLPSFLCNLWTCPVTVVESRKDRSREEGGLPLTADAESPAPTYRDWLLKEVDSTIRRSIENTGWGDPMHFLRRRSKVEELIPSHGGHRMAIEHGDTNAMNVLFHENGLSG